MIALLVMAAALIVALWSGAQQPVSSSTLHRVEDGPELPARWE